ncbi:MAG: DUF1847 domain-containing protein [Fibrobacteria bacterium]|nr:DUF1847 domain-containing protein [Fibrobacteria bacterium]
MECTLCKAKSCRSLANCGNETFDRAEVLASYHDRENQSIVQAAADLVDGGRAGTLSRVQEIAEFAKGRSWDRLGLAYCYGMETDAGIVSRFFRSRGLRVEAVSCTTGAFAQDEVDARSSLRKVSCNPLGQAAQLRHAKVDLVVEMGLCLGHDLLLRSSLGGIPSTTLVVKDRTTSHAPLEAIRRLP